MKRSTKRTIAILLVFAVAMFLRHQLGFEVAALLLLSTIFIYTNDSEP